MINWWAEILSDRWIEWMTDGLTAGCDDWLNAWMLQWGQIVMHQLIDDCSIPLINDSYFLLFHAISCGLIGGLIGRFF